VHAFEPDTQFAQRRKIERNPIGTCHVCADHFEEQLVEISALVLADIPQRAGPYPGVVARERRVTADRRDTRGQRHRSAFL